MAPRSRRAGSTIPEARGMRQRKIWQTGVLQSTAAGSEHGEMALWAAKKRHFRQFFDDFLPIFPGVSP
jgi:hypothetical protein